MDKDVSGAFLAMMLYWALLSDLAIFPMRISAFAAWKKCGTIGHVSVRVRKQVPRNYLGKLLIQ